MRRLNSLRSCLALLPALLAFTAGCDLTGPDEYEPQYVVEAYLEADAPFRTVRLSRTAPLEGSYNFDELAVRNAAVRVHLLGEGGASERTYAFEESQGQPGVYETAPIDQVLPGRTYRLEIDILSTGETITSETTVPQALELQNVSADSLVYQGGEQLEVEISSGPSTGDQRVFVFSTIALEPVVDNLTPFADAIYDPPDVTLEDLSRSSSPLLNEANYDLVGQNAIRIRLPWIAVLFYGRNLLSISAVDRNYYDYRRSADIQQGGSTLGPGEIPNILDHVEGGTGIFGSYARVSSTLYVAREGEL